MYLFIFWEANNFPIQTLYMCSAIQVFPFYFPSFILSCSMPVSGYVFGIRTPIIGVINRDWKCSSNLQSIRKSLSCLFPLCQANIQPILLSMAYHVQRWLDLFWTKLQNSSISPSFRISTSNLSNLLISPFVRKYGFVFSVFLTSNKPCLCLLTIPCRYLELRCCWGSSR